MSIPAGWYPDPAGGPRTRWWDGTSWTDTFQDPYAHTPVLTAPEGTRVYNLWIWLVLFLPYVTIPFLFSLDFSDYFASLYRSPESLLVAQLQLITSPALVLLTVGGWIAYAATVVLSWLDWRWLKAAGVPRPFHWAFGFIGGTVYAIGRAVITRRRTGRGIAVMVVAIGMYVLAIIVSTVWTFSFVLDAMRQIPFSY